MAKTNSGLIAYARAQLGRPYWWGTFGQIGSASLFRAKKAQYPRYYTATDFTRQFGKKVHDCAGLIKGYLWCDGPEGAPQYRASQDKSASGMYTTAKKKGPIGTFDKVPGRLLFRGSTPANISHVGIYAGNGVVVEAKGHAYGVVESEYSPRDWNFWAQHSDITCDTVADGHKAEQTAAAEASAADAKKPEPESTRKNCIDLSDIQWKKGLDLEAFIDKHPEIEIYIIKCSRAAESVNESFKPWADILTRKGKMWAGYHFLNNDKMAVGAVKEADYYVNQMGPYLGKAGLAMDYENETMGFAVGEGYAKAFLDRVYELTGIRPMIYTQQSRVNKLGAIHDAGYPLWVAAYGKNAKITKFNPDQVCEGLSPYKEAAMFQYSSNLYLSGYNDKLDCSVFYGTKADWQKMIAESSPAKASPVTTGASKPKTEEITVPKGYPSKTLKFEGRVTASALNVRLHPGVKNAQGKTNGFCSFSPLKKGKVVQVCDTVYAPNGEAWFYIRYNNLYGYVSAKYIEKVR